MKELYEISERLHTQDNQCTANPIFLVQRRVFDYGFDTDYCDDVCWVKDERCLKEGQKGWKALEYLHRKNKDTGYWRRIGYKERWEFVTACLTRAGCEEHIRLNGHNLGKTRIYIDCAFRNPEYTAIRDYLMSLTENKNTEAA